MSDDIIDEDDNKEIKSMADELNDEATNITDNPNAITRSVHIATRYGEVTVTTQDIKEDINMIKKIAEELIDKYLMTEEKSPYTQ